VLHAASAGALGGAPTAFLPHPARATRVPRRIVRPLASPPYADARRRRTARSCRDFVVSLACANRLSTCRLFKDPSSTPRVTLPATEPPLSRLWPPTPSPTSRPLSPPTKPTRTPTRSPWGFPDQVWSRPGCLLTGTKLPAAAMAWRRRAPRRPPFRSSQTPAIDP
jgi:hypothetical protein